MSNKDFFFLLVRLFLGYVFLSSGLCKLTHGEFAQLIGPPLLIDQLKEHGLELFGYIIASSQVVIGGLVMSQRFSLLGLIALVPINLGILAVTTSQGWTGTPYVNTFLLLLNIAALLYEYPTLKILIVSKGMDSIAIPKTVQLFKDWKWPLALLVLLATAIGFSFINNLVVTLLGSLFFLGLGVFIYQSTPYQLLQKLVLLCYFLSIISMTYARSLNQIGIQGELIFLAAAVLGFLLWVSTFFARVKTNV